jgi:hypothetical protein
MVYGRPSHIRNPYYGNIYILNPSNGLMTIPQLKKNEHVWTTAHMVSQRFCTIPSNDRVVFFGDLASE